MSKRATKKPIRHDNKGNIRIIAGKHRGRKLPVILAEGLRPTTDRVKETVFNWLMPYIQQSHCLDCFAGAGSLGFEALSRGAETVTLIELNKVAAQQLNENKKLLSADNLSILQSNALDYLKNTNDVFDIVFIDPPFRQELINSTLELLTKERLSENALVYLEMEKEAENITIPQSWRCIKEKVAGQVCYQLFQT